MLQGEARAEAGAGADAGAEAGADAGAENPNKKTILLFMSSVAEEGTPDWKVSLSFFSAHISLLLYEIQYFLFYISYHDISHTNIV